jgi:DNA helicase II / ATP-dependent DNA helicase PcrA
MSNYQKGLAEIQGNERQWSAFQKTGHTVVIAGPGSGKTKILSVKVAKLLRDDIIAPKGLACLTYTQMMANELEKRLNSFGVLDRPNVVTNTVHGFCLSHIIYPFAEIFELSIPNPIKIASKKMCDFCFDKARKRTSYKKYDPTNKDDCKFKEKVEKYGLQRADMSFDQWESQEYAKLLKAYYEILQDNGYVNFDLIVRLSLQLIINQKLVRQSLYSKFEWFVVDEYQDLGYPLFRIVTELIKDTPIKLFVIGDPDQSIYDFAGTDPKYLIELAKRPDMQPIFKLEENYRTASEIITISKTILKPFCNYKSDKKGGIFRIIEASAVEQNTCVTNLVQEHVGNGIFNNSIAILHPWRESNGEGINIIANEFKSKQIKFTLDKNQHYDNKLNLIRWLEYLGELCLRGFELTSITSNKTFDDLVRAWFKIVNPQALDVEQYNQERIKLIELIWSIRAENMHLNEWLIYVKDRLDFNYSLINYRKIFPDEVEELENILRMTNQDGELSKWNLQDFANLEQGIQLTTIHSSKGMEFDVVIIAGVEKIWNDENGKRQFYVGVTRAKREVCLVYSKTSSGTTPQYIKKLVRECQHLEGFSHISSCL